jgi:hypothetical protein
MTFWREGNRMRNVYLGSASKMDAEAAYAEGHGNESKVIGTVGII